MSADAQAAITTALGVRARIILDGHYASDEINDGVAKETTSTPRSSRRRWQRP